jgi:hypothetical protein
MSASPIVPIVYERQKRDGMFDCHHDGPYLCSSSSPFIDGCRHLLAPGHDSTTRIVMRHAGSEDDGLRGVLGWVAGVEIANAVGFRPARASSQSLARAFIRRGR